MDTFTPGFDTNKWSPDKSDLTRWYYELAKYLKDHPIPGDDTLGKIISDYLDDNPITGDFYSPNNPPPYPVTSVNGQTGAVIIEAGVGGDPNAYSPDNPPPYPVTSVNGQTGVVQVLEADVISRGDPSPKTKIFIDESEDYPSNIINIVYPIGSIYMSINSTNPSVLFGGTWEAIEGRFLLAAGSVYEAGSANGNSEITINNDNLPRSIRLKYSNKSEGGSSGGLFASTVYLEGDSSGSVNVGTYSPNTPINIMPPYLAVYMWQRTA